MDRPDPKVTGHPENKVKDFGCTFSISYPDATRPMGSIEDGVRHLSLHDI